MCTNECCICQRLSKKIYQQNKTYFKWVCLAFRKSNTDDADYRRGTYGYLATTLKDTESWYHNIPLRDKSDNAAFILIESVFHEQVMNALGQTELVSEASRLEKIQSPDNVWLCWSKKELETACDDLGIAKTDGLSIRLAVFKEDQKWSWHSSVGVLGAFRPEVTLILTQGADKDCRLCLRFVQPLSAGSCKADCTYYTKLRLIVFRGFE